MATLPYCNYHCNSMRLPTGSQLCLLLLVHTVGTVAGQNLNWTQCFVDIVTNATATQNYTGLLNSYGAPVSNPNDATVISYLLCTSACGNGEGPFYWYTFLQDFSAWLLPSLALISQLPFGAQYRLDDFISVVITIGSPVLAGYSLFITILNSRWIKRRFTRSVNYPNSRFAISILANLQQVPLKLHFDHTSFSSLVVLPENDIWWEYFSELVDYSHTWSVSIATSLIWVVVAYIMTVIISSNGYDNGQATGSMWLWLIPIVIGWLQISPKCDFDRLHSAYERADRYARGATSKGDIGKLPAPSRRALTIYAQEEDVMSPDELLTPPVFNYSRALQWASTVNTAFLVFEAASDKARNRITVRPGSDWVESDTLDDIHPSNRYGSPQDIAKYCAQPTDVQHSHWAPGVFTRMAVASCASLILQWGTVGAAVITTWFQPTIGLGCRSLSFLLYGVTSTIIWVLFLVSSILSHYSAGYSRNKSLSARVALASSHWLRRVASLLAIVNFVWLIVTCTLQYSNFYSTCFCNSSMFSRGKGAYIVIYESAAQDMVGRRIWIGSLVMAGVSGLFFMGLVNILLLPSTS